MCIYNVPWVRILPLPVKVNNKFVKLYSCKIWFGSTDLNLLKRYTALLPFYGLSTGLKTRLTRFTLLRSPLGNKRAKDQFERREYQSFYYAESHQPEKILSLLEVIKNTSGIKSKILVEVC